MFEPLYSPTQGGPFGFRCKVLTGEGQACNRVVRTYRGIKAHCWKIHKMRLQMEMFPNEENTRTDTKAEKPVRARKRTTTTTDAKAGTTTNTTVP